MRYSLRGLSFIEMLVTISIFGLIMVAIVNSVLTFYRANTSSIEQEFQVDNARKGVDVMVKDLREASYGDDGSYPVQTMASTTIIFYSDVDTDTSIERVKYQLIGNTLYRNITNSSGSPLTYTGLGATTTVSGYVRNTSDGTAVFHYFNASNTEITDPSLVATVVSVTVTLAVDITQKHTPGEFTLKGSATLRNLRAQ
jgi:prepilin-type N-terminal cleavage/methylation domain-containing protein